MNRVKNNARTVRWINARTARCRNAMGRTGQWRASDAVERDVMQSGAVRDP